MQEIALPPIVLSFMHNHHVSPEQGYITLFRLFTTFVIGIFKFVRVFTIGVIEKDARMAVPPGSIKPPYFLFSRVFL